ncbi:MAG TPA: DUF3048 domain-containing protein [Coriobacteriia bacterium]
MRPRIAIIVLAVAVTAIAASLTGCSAAKTIEALWPAASTERTVLKPAGSPHWPLTGLDAPSADATLIRVVSVKIENSPAARPQTGLDKADIVYEMISEGGITRFHALFQSQVPKVVGPVRSCRPPDLFLVPQYHSLLAHVGGPKRVRTALADKSRYNDMDQFFNPASYWRASTRPAPHNMYLDITKLRGFATSKRGYAATETITGLQFARASALATPVVTQLSVPVSSSNKVQWNYDPASHLYARSINGKAHTDAVTGKQLKARNVVVLWVQIKPYPGDKKGVVEITLGGSGRASVFYGGQRLDGTWEAGADSPPKLKTADGKPIKLDPGNTWFQVIGSDQSISMK